jgi:hypothetical protein
VIFQNTFCAIFCKRNREMTPLCKIEVTRPWFARRDSRVEAVDGVPIRLAAGARGRGDRIHAKYRRARRAAAPGADSLRKYLIAPGRVCDQILWIERGGIPRQDVQRSERPAP